MKEKKNEIFSMINQYVLALETRKIIEKVIPEFEDDTELDNMEKEMRDIILKYIEKYKELGGEYDFTKELKESGII